MLREAAASLVVGGRRAGAGRPAIGKDRVRTMRLSDDFMASVDAWAETAGRYARPLRSHPPPGRDRAEGGAQGLIIQAASGGARGKGNFSCEPAQVDGHSTGWIDLGEGQK